MQKGVSIEIGTVVGSDIDGGRLGTLLGNTDGAKLGTLLGDNDGARLGILP